MLAEGKKSFVEPASSSPFSSQKHFIFFDEKKVYFSDDKNPR